MRPWRALVVALAGLGLPAACSSADHPPALADRPPPVSSTPRGAAGEPGLTLGGDGPEPTGPCGSQTIPVMVNRPNVSFIIDHSGSMGDTLPGSSLSKYENARVALSHVLRAVGHRVSYGATIFPGLAGVTGCEAGDELMKVAPGDPASYAREGKTGPRLRDLLSRLAIADVDGGTPAAPTLSKMLETLTDLEGDTFVVLITDGAPNCNEQLFCSAAACIPNIEAVVTAGIDCTGSLNCCAPSVQDPQANLGCVDAQASVDAVQALSDAGIHTFVVGMPGSEPYEQLLNQMAEVGGTARSGASKYFSVADTEALQAALTEITASVAISCDIPLDYAPPDPDLVNVYFDDAVVEYDPASGWEWSADGHVAIRGDACDRLSSGDVLEVQILAGCTTVVK
jgi:hypothetical protein